MKISGLTHIVQVELVDSISTKQIPQSVLRIYQQESLYSARMSVHSTRTRSGNEDVKDKTVSVKTAATFGKISDIRGDVGDNGWGNRSDPMSCSLIQW